jgi:hypothetical protein
MIKRISDEPLNPAERAELIEKTAPLLTPSLVQYGQERRESKLRRSENYRWREDCVVSLKLRWFVAGLLQIDLQHIEPIDVVRYRQGDYFGRHHDGLHRSWTFCLALTDDFSGGALHFPRLQRRYSTPAGHAVLWPNDTLSTLHESEPIICGEKWVAVVWT